jgi:hypothetical protein
VGSLPSAHAAQTPMGAVHIYSRRAVSIDHACADLQSAIGDALGAQDDRHACGPRRVSDDGPRALEKHGIWRRRAGARPAIPGNEALRKADQQRALSARIGDRRCCEIDGFFGRRRNADVGQGNAHETHAVIL